MPHSFSAALSFTDCFRTSTVKPRNSGMIDDGMRMDDTVLSRQQVEGVELSLENSPAS